MRNLRKFGQDGRVACLGAQGGGAARSGGEPVSRPASGFSGQLTENIISRHGRRLAARTGGPTCFGKMLFSLLAYRGGLGPGPRAKLDIGGGGGGSGSGAGFFGRESSRVRIISSFALANFGVPATTPVAATISSVISCEAGRYFWK